MDEDEAIADIGVGLNEAVEAWVKAYFGGKCLEYDEGCPCCKAWAAVDTLFGDL